MLRALLVLFALAVALPPAASAQNRLIQQEMLLSEAEKRAIQEALAWTGHYEARIDGIFGPATRSAIRAFQQKQGFRPTGYLRQRHLDRLMERRTELSRRFAWELRRFPELGMEIGVPTALFSEPDSTEIGLRYRSKDGQPKSELLLYSAVPMSERRFELLREEVVDRRVFSRKTYDAGDENWFVFSGTSDKGVEQYTHVINRNDGVRGFSFRYLERDHDLLSPLNVAMYNSLRTFGAEDRPDPVTESPPGPPAPNGQSLFDEAELARLEGRPAPDRPQVSERRSTGFLVNATGAILTTASAIDGCESVRVNDRVDAAIKAVDRSHDLALLAIPDQRRDLPHLSFRARPLGQGEDVRALVYPREGERRIEGRQGRIEALRSTAGEIGRLRVAADLGGNSRGAPLIDQTGQVVGVVLGSSGPARTASAEDAPPPQDQRRAVHGLLAQAFLDAEGVGYAVGRPTETEGGLDERVRLATLSVACRE